jgi:hypothetical protein
MSVSILCFVSDQASQGGLTRSSVGDAIVSICGISAPGENGLPSGTTPQWIGVILHLVDPEQT